MGRSSEKESSIQTVAPFLKKCYEMVEDSSTDSVISWTQNDNSFVIWDMTEFSVRLLPKYFKHSNFSSFIRQLNIYGFRKIDTDRWEFANDGFIRGQKDLLKTIARRKNSQGTDNRKSSEQQESSVEPGEKVEKEGLWKEVENLKTDKNALMQELKKLTQHQEIAENNLLLVRNRMQGMEKNQQQMLSFLVMVMQNPGFLVQLLHPKEHNWRMAEPGSIIEQPVDDTEPLASGGVVVKYQPLVEELTKPVHVPTTDAEKPPESNGSSAEMKDVFIAPDFMKVLMDENFPSLENHAPFILPELSDDVAWEQLLSYGPSLENIEDTRQDGKESDDTESDLGSTVSGSHMDGFQIFDFLTEELENSENLENSVDPQGWLENSQGMEMITKQLGRLVSETNHKDGLQ